MTPQQRLTENNTFLSPHTFIDLLVTRCTPDDIHTLTVTDGLSDHFTIVAKTKFQHNPVDSKCNILYRYAHSIDVIGVKGRIMSFERSLKL